MPDHLWDSDQPVLLLKKGTTLTPKVPVASEAAKWCDENLETPWEAVFVSGEPVFVCDDEQDLIHFRLRWG
jgi:hypothetical protein